MALDHFLPAAFVGGFSASGADPARDRVVWVARRGATKPFRRRAGKVAAERDLYTPQTDAVWAQSEALLREAIAALLDGSNGLGERYEYLWHRSLIPFLAGLFVRGPEVARRFSQRFPHAFGRDLSVDLAGHENVNSARVIELQRLLAPVMYADWDVVSFAGGSPLITTDLGYAPTRHVEGRVGYTVPLNREAAVVLYPATQRAPGRLQFFETYDARGLNTSMAASAVKEAYCASQELAEEALKTMAQAGPESAFELGPALLGAYDPDDLRAMETDWLERGDEIKPWEQEPDADKILVAVRITQVGYVVVPLRRGLEMSRDLRRKYKRGFAMPRLWERAWWRVRGRIRPTFD